VGEDAVELEVDGHAVRVSHPGKVFFSERGETKLDLIRYYEAVAVPLLERLRGRAVMMQRFPDGASGKSFFQKRVPNGAPDWLQTAEVQTVNGTSSQALVIADLAHVIWAVNLGCLGFHVWPFHVNDASHADELRIDLDPMPGLRFDDVRRAARLTKALLDELGIRSFPKTTGSRGIHVYVPLRSQWDAYDVRRAAVALARELERRHPNELTAQWWKEERGKRVFVDFNQNAPHKTVFGAWSVRARVGAQVSCPFLWEDLDLISPDELTIATVPARLGEQGDAWAAMSALPQSIEPLLALWERDVAAGLPDAPWPPEYPKMPGEATRVSPSRAKHP